MYSAFHDIAIAATTLDITSTMVFKNCTIKALRYTNHYGVLDEANGITVQRTEQGMPDCGDELVHEV